MDRRTTLTTLLGKSKSKKEKSKAQTLVFGNLDPYTGPWGFDQAAHLLRRAMIGPNSDQITTAINEGLATTVQKLLNPPPLASGDLPLNPNNQDDLNVPVGSTWVNVDYHPDNLANVTPIRAYRRRSLQSWIMDKIMTEGVSIRENMILFWHNHFVTADEIEGQRIWQTFSIFRENALGSFKDLAKLMTLDPYMLRYLNGNQNSRVAPNENYARELLELFTIGKGPQVGPGDYTHYTEEDVKQAARVLSGWRDDNRSRNDQGMIDVVFVPNRHDSGDKVFSHRFDNMVISDMGDQEYAFLIDKIFEKSEVARHLARKLYRWFVYYKFDADTEANVIEPMAQLILDNDYEIKPALSALLQSVHFYDMLNYGPRIKDPLNFVFSGLKALNYEFPGGLNTKYNLANRFYQGLRPLEMDYMNPPSVAGWKAFYQEPSFSRLWINSVTLPIRLNLTNTFARGGRNAPLIDILAYVDSLDNPYDPNELILHLTKILLPRPLVSEQYDFLKEVLIPGLPDDEWTIEYGNYVANPNDQNIRNAVEGKLQDLLSAIFAMPEFHLS